MPSGNRTGIKMYSFNTTVRMPDKNIEFLELFKKYENLIFDDTARLQYYIDAIQIGIVKPKNVIPEVREKIRSGIKLTSEEIEKILRDNKPHNGFSGRVGDFLSAMTSQGFIQKQGKRFRITQLGNELIEHPENEADIYTKAMLILEYGSSDRITAENKAIPFLNTIFVIDGINKYNRENNIPKSGISEFELGVFVLTMSDCNYARTIKEILAYRKEYDGKINYEFAMDFVHNVRKILKIQEDTLYGPKSYTNEVVRKFKKTGLFTERKLFKNTYIDFSEVEQEKIKLLVEEYSNYKWKLYRDNDDYFNDIETNLLPWEKDDSKYAQILKRKAEILGYQKELTNLDRNKYNEIEKMYNNYIFQTNSIIEEIPIDIIINELQMINGKVKGRSMLPDTENYVKLEWFTALLLSKKFGKKYVKSNLTFFDDGTPKSCAGGGEADIEFKQDNIDYNIEVTTISNLNQQANKETTSVLRHLEDTNITNGDKEARAIMVAPYIHFDTIQIYKISAIGISQNTIAIPITIECMIKLIMESKDIEEFNKKIEEVFEKLKQSEIAEYQKYINSIKIDSSYEELAVYENCDEYIYDENMPAVAENSENYKLDNKE